MKKTFLTPILCMASSFCLLTADAKQDTAPAPIPPLEQAKRIADDVTKAMNGIMTALDRIKDEKSAQEVADSIISSSKKIQELTQSSRDLQKKISNTEKQEIVKTMEQINVDQYNKRFNKTLTEFADKPELLKILKPAKNSFDLAAASITAKEKNKGQPVRLIDKGGRVRINE